MRIRSLSLVNFKNYEEATLDFSPEVNCLVGDNGSGKTTVLDAIYYLSFCKSYFNPIDSQNVRYDQSFFLIQSQVEKAGEVDKLHCGVKSGQKKQFRRNDKEYQRLADHIGLYPAVILTPNDIDLVKEGSEVRRKFMDGIISQYDRKYLDSLLEYNRALLQRNNLLRFFAENRTYDEESLEVWDHALVKYGEYIHEQRTAFVEKFISFFNEVYQKISGGAEAVSLMYQSQMIDKKLDDLLQDARGKDRQLRRTTQGIHKDDLSFLIQDHPIKKFGSQGQQKTYLIALKLAQYSFIEEATGEKPVLLLDDIFDKIDDKRVGALMELVSQGAFGQIFITDTHEERIPKMFREIGCDLNVFHVNQGAVDSDAKTMIHGEEE
ncbi:DNA replication/repair protein RecF [Sanyastnella coralliicola]|uniref:DNA replication/repair protein RecF n=1 Tax=Sanyastnella coralliicola TaxID=3069118 RepID=UPI0027BAC64C|nr:DNA replication/repair protein RecF [Longitalea sp. SCSIO 12813]